MSTRGAPPSAVLQPGATFSHYRVDERIGAGGMGTVYRARDTRLGRDVAIKVINADIASDPDRIARFHREANTVATLGEACSGPRTRCSTLQACAEQAPVGAGHAPRLPV